MARFTVFDVMEAKGVFKKNPANIGSQDANGAALYSGPVQYPRMMYHPDGKERVIQAGEIVVTPMGPQRIMEQREIIHQIVNNYAEEQAAVAAGWHTHPSNAIRASGKEAPPTGADQVIADLQRKIKELEAQQKSLEASQAVEAQPEAVVNSLAR
jgi:hypothetical protein